jgi:cell division protein FtsI (penicillin-binding protein 3)
MTPETAHALRDALVETVERGTAIQADLSTFALAGKTGTARRVEGHGGYRAHAYTASFVGLFPARDPQYVILVKIDDPVGTYFGGAAAAPVSKAILEAAIAARDAALDRGALAARDRGAADTSYVRAMALPNTAAAGEVVAVADTPLAEPDPVVIPLTGAGRGHGEGTPVTSADTQHRAVPDVHGMTLRAAVHALHRAGFRVQLIDGRSGDSWPAAGSMARAESIVRLARAP